MSRDRILARIRNSCRSAHSAGLPETLPDFPHYSDPVEHFGQELVRAGGTFLDGRGESRLLQALRQILSQSSDRQLVWENSEIPAKHRIPHVLQGCPPAAPAWLLSSHPEEIEFPVQLRWEPYQRGKLDAIETSVSSAVQGIAETGTVVHQSGPGVGRILAVLPPRHLTFLRAEDLVPNHAFFFERLQPGRAGSVLTLSTGPSRTADIEKTLVLGVHGPQQWFVVLTE